MDREPVSVSQLNAYLKDVLDNDINLSYIPVRGEISNLKIHSSGHIYFTLKDQSSKIKCVMFKSYALFLKFRPEDGINVIIHGSVSVYERDGQYQFYCVKMESDGIGDLYVAYEQLKRKLEQEGIFDQARKQPLPLFPRRIGVATSLTGAVIRDIINVSLNRYKGVDILLYPVSVQGAGAAETLCNAIEYFNTRDDIDVIIIGRGGGSIEELWAFNEEILARAIYSSHIPIVSAVGHETDFTISDFAADVRASTPSHAAELAVPLASALDREINSMEYAILSCIMRKIKAIESNVNRISSYIDSRSPDKLIIQSIQYIDSLQSKIDYCIEKSYYENRKRLEMALNSMDAYNPANVLKRGYGYVRKDNKLVRNVKEVGAGDSIEVFLQNGCLLCTINSIMEDSNG